MKKKFGTGILVFVLCFGYLFLQNKIPDEVSVRPGETLQLHTGIPLSMEQKEEEPVTLASMVFGTEWIGEQVKNRQLYAKLPALWCDPDQGYLRTGAWRKISDPRRNACRHLCKD